MLGGRYVLCFLLTTRCLSLAFHFPALLTTRSKSCQGLHQPEQQRLSCRFVQLMSLSPDDETASNNNNLVEETPTVPSGTEVSSDRTVATRESTTVQPVTTESSPYPINLPSPALLALSIFLSIASIGSVFELATKNEDLPLGVLPTVAVAVLGVPTCFFLFYAAVLKGKAETEEDDKVFRAK